MLGDKSLAHSDVLTHAATCSLAGRQPRLSWLQPQKLPERICPLLAGVGLKWPADPTPWAQAHRPWAGMEPCCGGGAGGPVRAMPSHAHFTGGEIEAQRGQVAFPKSQSEVKVTQQI